MPDRNGTTGHPIRVVAERTGLTAATLRAWERRYDVVVPTRSDGGHRLYSDEDVHRLRTLVRAVAGGRSIGQVAPLSTPEIEELIKEDEAERMPESIGADTVGGPARAEQVTYALGLVEAMKPDDLERFLMRAAVSLGPAEVVSGILVPLLAEIGSGWQSGRFGASPEHVASVAIRRYLDWLTNTVQVDRGAPLAVTGTPAGQRHEFGALLAGVLAADEGWRVRFLGPDLPAREIRYATDTLGASLVALSAVHPELPFDVAEDVAQLRRDLPPHVDVVIGGRAAAPHRALWGSVGILYFDSLEDYRHGLSDLHERRFGTLESNLLPLR